MNLPSVFGNIVIGKSTSSITSTIDKGTIGLLKIIVILDFESISLPSFGNIFNILGFSATTKSADILEPSAEATEAAKTCPTFKLVFGLNPIFLSSFKSINSPFISGLNFKLFFISSLVKPDGIVIATYPPSEILFGTKLKGSYFKESFDKENSF